MERARETGHAVRPNQPRRATTEVTPEAAGPWLGTSASALTAVADSVSTVDDAIRALVASHELERRRIARDLHDVVGQALTAIRLHLALIANETSRVERLAAEVGEAMEVVDTALRQVRDLAFEVRPAVLDDVGLVAAARTWVARQARISGYVAEFKADVGDEAFAPDITSACFRTLQEALTNVSRHAAASCVEVTLVQSAGTLTLTIRDNGVGFDVDALPATSERGSLGLLGAWERIALVGGTLTIDSIPGQGTSLMATFPVRERELAPRRRR